MTDDESIVIKPREFSADLLLPENTSELAKFMDEPLTAIAETMTGAMAEGPKAWMIMGGRIVQSMFKAKLFQQVSQEIKGLRDIGAIPEDYADESKYRYGAQTWVELFTAIDNQDAPDADRLDALKAMFYGVNKTNATDVEKILSYRMFQIAKRLSSGELLVLKAVYESAQTGAFSINQSMGNINLVRWAEQIATQMKDQKFVEIVLHDQRKLVEEGLLAPLLAGSDAIPHDTQISSRNGRLTTFGRKFCEAMRDYQLVREQIDLREKKKGIHPNVGDSTKRQAL